MSIETSEFRFPSVDGMTDLYAKKWLAASSEGPRFVVQLVHGMSDFIDRYDEFARFLALHGAAVYGHDMLGHGHTAQNNSAIYGYFADREGEKILVEDMHTLNGLAHAHYPGLPLILFGHSMGSLLAREYTARYGDTISGAVYSGTSGPNSLTGIVRCLVGVGKLMGRKKKPAPFLSHLAFSKYNDRVENPRTPNDWLTRDEQIVDAYNANPWNTFLFTDQACYDFANLVDSVSDSRWANCLPKDIGYLLISGEMDPVGDYGAGVRTVYELMKNAGIPDLTLKIYPEARHELTNEINRAEVFEDIFQWIQTHVTSGPEVANAGESA